MRKESAALVALALCASAAQAQDVPIEPGVAFKLSGVAAAPWAGGTSPPAGIGALRGKPVTFAVGRVSGPHPLGCTQARYGFHVQPPEGLFQGGLPAPAAEAARRMGLGAQTLTMRVDCSSGSFDFHVLSDRKLLLGLDNAVWTLERAAGGPGATPEAVVQRLLVDHFTHEMAFTPETVARKRNLLTASLNNAIAVYFRQVFPEDEPPPINGDPITNTQDYPTSFEIARAVRADRVASVRVVFSAEGMTRPVVFRLRRGEGAGWRVDDLVYEDRSTFRQSLAAKP